MRGPHLLGSAVVKSELAAFPVHADARGTLMAVEGADVGFPVQRVFTVRGTEVRVRRGGHAPGCRELLVLVAGRAVGTVRSASGETAFDLATTGEWVRVDPTDHVDYALDPHSVLLVLCDRPYRETT